MREVHRLLKPGASLFIANVVPSTDSWSARLMRQKWMEFKVEHLTYFDRATIETTLFGSGFRDIVIRPGWKILSFDYIRMHFQRFPVSGVTPLLSIFIINASLLPHGMRCPAPADGGQRRDGFFTGRWPTGRSRYCRSSCPPPTR